MKALRLVAPALLVPALAVLPGRFRAPAPEVQQLSENVYAVLRHDPIAFANNANSLVVVGDDAVLVVDAQYTRRATLETLRAIRGLTTRPVRYVVNTHWHDDHAAGNQVYRDSFPGVEFIAQENTRRDLATLGAENRKATIGISPAYLARLERLVGMGLGLDSTPTVPLERAALLSTDSIGRQYYDEAAGFRETLPTLTFSRSLTLHLGARRVEVHWYGRGNTAGDAVVVVPDARVVATGDLVVHPFPFAFNSYPTEWVATLDSVRALRAAAYVPGHGPVLRDDTYIVHVRDMLARIRDETSKAVADGLDLPATRRRVTLADERTAMTGGDKWKNVLFTSFFLAPAVGRAFEEARAAKR